MHVRQHRSTRALERYLDYVKTGVGLLVIAGATHGLAAVSRYFTNPGPLDEVTAVHELPGGHGLLAVQQGRRTASIFICNSGGTDLKVAASRTAELRHVSQIEVRAGTCAMLGPFNTSRMWSPRAQVSMRDGQGWRSVAVGLNLRNGDSALRGLVNMDAASLPVIMRLSNVSNRVLPVAVERRNDRS